MIKNKKGICADCPPNSAEVPLIAGRCNRHYWQYRSRLKDPKAKDQPKKSHIPAKSANQLQRDIAYAKLRKSWLPHHPACEARLEGCQGQANQVHHKQGREGILLLDMGKWLAVCHPCHQWITEHSAEAIAKGLSLRRNR